VNLHGLAVGVISAVNPLEQIVVLRSTGQTTQPDGKRVPQYADPTPVFAQVQSLTADDLRQIDGLNLQGVKRAIYINGRTDGIIRRDQKGGDLVIRSDGVTWLNVHVLEYWPDWCKFVVTMQDDTVVVSVGGQLDFSNPDNLVLNVALGGL
jgi:hypothetical protein